MTIEELSQLYYLKKEIKELKAKKEKLQKQIDNFNSFIVCDSVQSSKNDITYAKCCKQISGVPEKENRHWLRIRAELESTKKIIELKEQERTHQYCMITCFIQEIEDVVIRQVFEYRFIDLMPWQKVADEVGGNNTEDSVKKLCYRYIRRYTS